MNEEKTIKHNVNNEEITEYVKTYFEKNTSSEGMNLANLVKSLSEEKGKLLQEIVESFRRKHEYGIIPLLEADTKLSYPSIWIEVKNHGSTHQDLIKDYGDSKTTIYIINGEIFENVFMIKDQETSEKSDGHDVFKLPSRFGEHSLMSFDPNYIHSLSPMTEDGMSVLGTSLSKFSEMKIYQEIEKDKIIYESSWEKEMFQS